MNDLHLDKRMGTKAGQYVFYHPGGPMFKGHSSSKVGWYFWNYDATMHGGPCKTEAEARAGSDEHYRLMSISMSQK